MPLKDAFRREMFVVVHGQTARFRAVKYLVLFVMGAIVYWWGGWSLVARVFVVLFVLGIIVHFLFRWKTKAWTQDWGPYKKLKLPT